MKKILYIFLVFICIPLSAIDGIILNSVDNSLHDKWYKTLGKTVPKMVNANKIFKGQRVEFAVFFQNYLLNAKGKSKVVYDIKIIDPHGNIFLERKNITALDSEIIHPEYVQMSEENLVYIFNFNDPFGDYQVVINLYDKISNDTKFLKSQFRIQELPKTHTISITKKDTFQEWIYHYRLNPEPEKALSYFLLFSKSHLTDDDSVLLPIIAFFQGIFTNNPYLFSNFASAYKTADNVSKNLLSLLLYESVGEEKFTLYTKDKINVQKIKEFGYPSLGNEIYSKIQIDMLWNNYFANSSQKSILKIIQTLDYAKYKGSIPKLKENNSLHLKLEANKEALYKSTLLSLKYYLKNDNLVLNYANYILAHENLTKYQKTELAILIHSIKD